MAAQQIQIAETIRSLKIALKRKADDSESEDDINLYTNRGNKLKRSARYVRQGCLDVTDGIAYREKIDHAGYSRNIISRNPPLVDIDGEPWSPTSSVDDERFYGPDEDEPFGGVHLDQLLKPLTAIHELADHPSLGLAYRTKALSEMAKQAAQMLRAEREILWRAKRLLKRFEGEADWAPCALFETDADGLLLHNPADAPADRMSLTEEQDDEAQNDVQINDMSTTVARDFNDIAETTTETVEAYPDPGKELQVQNGHNQDGDDRPTSPELNASENGSLSTTANMHAMTTRARARSPRASASPSPSPSDSASVPAISPWFLIPASSGPDRDLGLPVDEAESTRKLLLIYCQKQEQTIRSLEILYAGLQRGDRLRHFVVSSATAAGHLVPDGKNGLVTEMSDGEDWFDPVEYGRLEKGKDEVEDVEEEGRRGGRRRRVVGRV